MPRTAETTMIILVAALQAPALAQAAASPDAGAVPASATISTASWYLRNEVGANLIPSISLKDKSVDLGFGTATATGGKLSMDAGVAWNVAVGHKFTDWLAFELSSGIVSNSFDRLSATYDIAGAVSDRDDAINGSLLQVPVMAGVRFELPVGERVRINLGGSVGGMYMYGESETTVDIVGIPVVFSGSDSSWAFAFSGTVGVDLELASNVGLGVFYRFLGTTSASFGPVDLIDAEGVYNQQVGAALTIRF